MGKLNGLWRFVRRHNYICIFAVFALLIGVVDENSVIHRMEMRDRIVGLRKEICDLRACNERDSVLLLRMTTDLNTVRTVARERYYMYRENEDLFVFVDADVQLVNAPVDNAIMEYKRN